jgi:hypothetical protein
MNNACWQKTTELLHFFFIAIAFLFFFLILNLILLSFWYFSVNIKTCQAAPDAQWNFPHTKKGTLVLTVVTLSLRLLHGECSNILLLYFQSSWQIAIFFTLDIIATSLRLLYWGILWFKLLLVNAIKSLCSAPLSYARIGNKCSLWLLPQFCCSAALCSALQEKR